MATTTTALSPEATEKMIAASIGDGTTIRDVVRGVFGRRRTREALANPELDPEFVGFVLTIDALVNKAWQRRGITRHLGPYVESAGSD